MKGEHPQRHHPPAGAHITKHRACTTRAHERFLALALHLHPRVWANLRSDLGPNSSEAQRQAALYRALDILSK